MIPFIKGGDKRIMKRKIYSRPICILISEEMFNEIKTLTDQDQISISEYIRFAIQDKLEATHTNPTNQPE